MSNTTQEKDVVAMRAEIRARIAELQNMERQLFEDDGQLDNNGRHVESSANDVEPLLIKAQNKRASYFKQTLARVMNGLPEVVA